jgi:hypothetical protein
VRDDHGTIVKWYGVNTDIEDRKRSESLLAAEKRTLEMIAGGASLLGGSMRGVRQKHPKLKIPSKFAMPSGD